MDKAKVEAVVKALNWVKFNTDGAAYHTFEKAVSIYVTSAINLINDMSSEIEQLKNKQGDK